MLNTSINESTARLLGRLGNRYTKKQPINQSIDRFSTQISKQINQSTKEVMNQRKLPSIPWIHVLHFLKHSFPLFASIYPIHTLQLLHGKVLILVDYFSIVLYFQLFLNSFPFFLQFLLISLFFSIQPLTPIFQFLTQFSNFWPNFPLSDPNFPLSDPNFPLSDPIFQFFTKFSTFWPQFSTLETLQVHFRCFVCL